MNAKLELLVLFAALSFATAQTIAGEEVCYVPVRGEGLTAHVPEYDAEGNLLSEDQYMLGRYSLVLKKTTSGPGKKTLRLTGPLRGEMDPDQTLNHILGVDAAEGLIYSFNDTPIEYIPIYDCQAHATEIINVTLGTGIFTGAHGTLTTIVDLDYCAKVNEIVVVPKVGEICFSID
jgi:hypothetical protein